MFPQENDIVILQQLPEFQTLSLFPAGRKESETQPNTRKCCVEVNMTIHNLLALFFRHPARVKHHRIETNEKGKLVIKGHEVRIAFV